ncbi:hypothetical protein QBE55_07000 [Eubacteriales bacterium mix99]
MFIKPRPVKPNWEERRRIVFKNKCIYKNLQKLINKAKSGKTSLAVFKPAKILDFIVEPGDRNWNSKRLAGLQYQSQQIYLFRTMEEIEDEFKTVQKVPYEFSYQFEDDSGRKSKLMIEDWEIGMLYFRCLSNAKGNENTTIAKVKEKYYTEFRKRDLYFFGNYQAIS